MWNLHDGTSVNHLSLEHARELAGEIASSYFSGGVAPTSSLQKIAQSEELTPHQIEVIAAEANKAIHAHKYAALDEKYFAAEFPLADAKQVIQSLQSGGTVKVAAQFTPPKNPISDFDPFKAFGVEPEMMDKTASVKNHLKVAEVRMELLQQKQQDQSLLTKEAAQATETKFIKQARQMALVGDTSLERMNTLGWIYQFAKQASFEKVASPALAKVAYVLKREGMLEPVHAQKAMDFFMQKTADQTAPTELISENLQGKVMVINGQHPLYITLKTMEDYSKTRPDLDHQISICDDKLNAVRQKIREL
jgi:hypothetical protein